MEIAPQNDYGMVWMNPTSMLIPTNQNMSSTLPQDMLQLDPNSSQIESPYYPMSVPPSFDSVTDPSVEMEGFLMMDDYDQGFCGEPPRYMTAATQTGAVAQNRKIKPVRHPGLKLQTPIAYKCDTDPSVIPIQKDGMAICEKCGAIGVKHSFYTRHRKYCSLACARGSFGENKDEDMDDERSQSDSNHPFFKYPNGVEVKEEEELVMVNAAPWSSSSTVSNNNNNTAMITSSSSASSSSCSTTVSQFPSPNLDLPLDDESLLPPVTNKRVKLELANSYEWNAQLEEPGFIAVPVSCFKHVPMSDCWDNVTVGMKVEVENRDCDDVTDSFWVATVLSVAGYKVLLRYEGFGQNKEKDFWINLCSNNVHHVGWCATRGKPLIPPKTIEDKYHDWKEFLVKRLTGARTLPSNFYSKVHDSLRSRFRVGLNVEVVDKNRISQVCLATVKNIVGKRLHVEYYNSEPDDNGFWCHEDSPLIHPVGWASRVGHLIDAPDEYKERCESGLIETDDATEELFTAPQQSGVVNLHVEVENGFREGMKLEAVDPLNLSSICVATVMKVLNDNYIMIRIDSYPADVTGADWFCYHISSPCIFPPGFCHKHSITLTPPKEYEQTMFDWESYISRTGAVVAPNSLFDKEVPSHGFVVGMRVEAADLMDPRLVCVGTVSRVVDRLLKIHFDGWEEEYDQWLDCESPDVYPVGWCQLVGHKLEGPRTQAKPNAMVQVKKRTRRRKNRIKNLSASKKVGVGGVGGAGAGAGGVKVEMDTQDENINTENITDRVRHSNSIVNPMTPVDDVKNVKVEPAAAVEPTGPDQSLPVVAGPLSSTTNTTTSITTSNSTTSTNHLPRLTADSRSSALSTTNVFNPTEWSVHDVVDYLNSNDCGSYSDVFNQRSIDGKTLLSLTQDQIMDLTGFKIGPTLKISELIQQLRTKASKSMLKKKL